MGNGESTRRVGVVDGILLASWTVLYAFLLFGFQSLKRLERIGAKRSLKKPTATGGDSLAAGKG